MNNALKIADKLKYQGIKILKVTPESELVDAEIQLEGDYHIQVGQDYMELVKEIGGQLLFVHVAGNSVGELVRLITTR